jgi:hypothetical protein
LCLVISALEGKGIPLVARRLREMLNDTVSVSARVGVNEHDGDLPSPSTAGEESPTASAPEEGAAKEAGGRRRRSPLPSRRRSSGAAVLAEE